MSPDPKTLDTWKHHWQDEFDAAYLYRTLASLESDRRKVDIFTRLAEVEDKHVELWAEVLGRHGRTLPSKPTPTFRARFLGWIARRFSSSALVSLMLREEGQEVRGYLKLHRETIQADAKEATLTLAKESAEHAEELKQVAGLDMTDGEPWHRTGSGGFLRNVIYGFNDGLTANFGLVAGVIGATTGAQEQIILVTGVAGTVADALSMGASGFLAAKSEQEVYEHEIRLEKDEIELMPEVEEEELALIYETKGINRDQAKRMASEVMKSAPRALEEKVREELGITEAHSTPFREGWVTGLATAIGAFIPVLPFLFLSGSTAVWTAFTLAMVSHFGVGAMRSLFTGRGILRSGFDMFVVGLGVAIVGYFVGDQLEKIL